jgi:hypothetical protein
MKVLNHLPTERAAGSCHDRMEGLSLVVEHGGAEFVFNFLHTIADATIHHGVVSIVRDLRAVLVLKDNGSMRPIGIGECIRRTLFSIVSQQDRKEWALFFTSLLPEDQLASTAACEDAARDVSSIASQLANLQKLTDPSQEDAAAVSLSADMLQVAEAELLRLRQPVNFPTNHCFSAGGAETVAHTIQAWHEMAPENCTINDDLRNMYNLSDRDASFRALRQYSPCLVPMVALFYAEPATIRLVAPYGPVMRVRPLTNEQLAAGLYCDPDPAS